MLPSLLLLILSTLTLLLSLSLPPSLLSYDISHHYIDNEEVTFWFNKVGPYHNPQETYDYFSLPLCRPTHKSVLREKSHSLGVILEGDELTDSGIISTFKTDVVDKKLCEFRIEGTDTLNELLFAVKNHYWYQMYIDELPVWGMVGEYMRDNKNENEKNNNENKEGSGFIYTHKEFTISYNSDRIISVNLTSERPLPLVLHGSYPLTISIHWVPTDHSFEKRFDRYLDFDFFEHQIHWFSIFNSFMMVIFLCGLVTLILMKTLKNDYTRYNRGIMMEEGGGEEMMGMTSGSGGINGNGKDVEGGNLSMEFDRALDESGWKVIASDVFRAPKYLLLFSALIGTGYQLLALSLFCILLTLLSTFYDERGSGMTAAIILYSLTSFLNGYSSSSLYKQYNGIQWKKVMILTAILFPSLISAIGLLLHIIAVSYDSSAAWSFSTIFYMVMIWATISFPLVILGTLYGRRRTLIGDFPCRVTISKRPIPNTKGWYTHPHILSLMSGILPFGSIFIEMYFIFTSFWNYKFYYVYGFMLLVYIILSIVTVCVVIVSLYIILHSEDWRWHWLSVQCGSSISIYVFLYSIYYFITKTRMSGMMQTCYYFGYMIIACGGLGMMGGTIGYIGGNAFVRRIYSYIKSD